MGISPLYSCKFAYTFIIASIHNECVIFIRSSIQKRFVKDFAFPFLNFVRSFLFEIRKIFYVRTTLCPWMVAPRIFVVVSYRQAQLKKSKQIFKIWHVQIYELQWTLVNNPGYKINSVELRRFKIIIGSPPLFITKIVFFGNKTICPE